MSDAPNFIRRKASDRTHFVGCCARFSSGHLFCFGANPVFVGLLLHFLLPIFLQWGKCRDFFNLSKSVCADCEDDSLTVLRYMDAAMRREKGKVVFIQAQR